MFERLHKGHARRRRENSVAMISTSAKQATRNVALLACVALLLGGVAGSSSAHSGRPCEEARLYPGDDAPREQIAAWMAREALKKGLPRELPVMAALEVSDLSNRSAEGSDSAGFFQMRTSIWDQGQYAGFGEDPDRQMRWFVDQAKEIAKALERSTGASPADDEEQWGEWVDDIEKPEVEHQGRYQDQLAPARELLDLGCG